MGLEYAEPRISREYTAHTARLRISQGRVQEAKGRPKLARIAYERAIDLLQDTTVARESLRAAQLNLAQLAIESGKLDEAERLLRAADETKPPEATNSRVASHFFRARLAMARGELESARQRLRQALSLKPVADWKWEVELALGRALRALGRSEEAAAMFDASIETAESLRRETAARQHWVAQARRAPFEELFDLRLSEGEDEDAVAVMQRARDRAFVDAVLAHRSRASVVQWGLEAARSQLELAEAVERADAWPVDGPLDVRPDDRAWAFFRAIDKMYRVEFYSGRARIVDLGIAPDDVTRLAAAWLGDLDDRDAGTELARAILPERLPDPDGALYVITDGELAGLPFAALPWGDHQLIDHFAVAYLPRFSMLAQPRTDDLPTGTSLILADAMGDLPDSRLEAMRVAKRRGALPYVGASARLGSFVDRPVSVELLHLSLHAGLDDVGAWIEAADGRFYSVDLLELPLRSEIAVISSCSAAARPGRGMWGSLAAVWLAKGSRAVVAPLWPVGDAPSRTVVEAFYDANGPDDPIEGLRQAQLHSRSLGLPTSEWAAFVVMGPGRDGVRG